MRTCPQCDNGFDAGHMFCPLDGTALVAQGPADPYVGMTLLGQFTITDVAGRGATGTVYRAWQATMERWVAVKIMHPEWIQDASMVTRFHREARAVARLSHPNIVSVHAAGTAPNGAPFIVMELVDGESLERALETGRLAPTRAVRIARQIVAALADTHAEGIVHRDLKPANVMLAQRRRASDVVKVLDFGVAKLLGARWAGDDGKLTTEGAICGTPHYVSPEQASGDTIDHRTDIYAVGCMLYKMVTGRVPFGGSGMVVLLAHVHNVATPPDRIVEDVGPALSALIMRCLEKDPDARFQSAEELADALDAIEDLDDERNLGTMDTIALPGVARELDRLSDSVAVISHAAPNPESTAHLLRRRPRWRRCVLGVIAAAAVALLAFGGSKYSAQRGSPAAVAVIDENHAASHALARGDVAVPDTVSGPTGQPHPPHTRAVVVGEGGYSLRLLLPERIVVGLEYDILLEAWDPDGEPITTSEMIVTIDDPLGTSRGIAAKPTQYAGRYRFTRRFEIPGSYELRVFPPAGGTTIRVFYDVVNPLAGDS